LNNTNNNQGSEKMNGNNEMKTTTKTTTEKPVMIWICYETSGGIPEVMLAGDEAAARQWWKWNVEDRFDEEPCQYNDGITALTSWDEGHGFYGSSEGTEYRIAVMPFTKGVAA